MLKKFEDPRFQLASNEVDQARDYYCEAKFKSAAAWKFYMKFVDEDPRFIDLNAPDEEVEYFYSQCDEYLNFAYLYEEEMYLAHQHLDAAKARLLALYDEEVITQ